MATGTVAMYVQRVADKNRYSKPASAIKRLPRGVFTMPLVKQPTGGGFQRK
ncbi:MAG: hypothetical protein K8F91_14545 [Candidatus Obscuribacterales bacterium]|nr:hypothetical protein [Candidatus Obscuribacterales bacterium]